MKYETKQCLFCGENEELEKLYPQTFTAEQVTPSLFSARRPSDRLHYEIVKCRNCGLVFSRRILADDVLSDLYQNSSINYQEYTEIIKYDYWNALYPYLKQINRGAALEIGCGNGFFLEELLKQGFQKVAGVEPSLSAVESATPLIRESIKKTFFAPHLYPSNSFDLICSFQTLDHVADPMETIRACFELLKPKGMIYFITHDVDSLSAKLLRDRSPIFDIEHIYLFNKNTLGRLLAENGFNIIDIFKIKNSYPISYWIKLLGHINIYNAIMRTGMGSIRFPIYAGNIGIIGEKRNENT